MVLKVKDDHDQWLIFRTNSISTVITYVNENPESNCPSEYFCVYIENPIPNEILKEVHYSNSSLLYYSKNMDIEVTGNHLTINTKGIETRMPNSYVIKESKLCFTKVDREEDSELQELL